MMPSTMSPISFTGSMLAPRAKPKMASLYGSLASGSRSKVMPSLASAAMIGGTSPGSEMTISQANCVGSAGVNPRGSLIVVMVFSSWFDDMRAEPDPGSQQRGARHRAHADQHDPVAGLLADRAVGTNELGLAVGEAEQFGAWNDVLMEPSRRGVSADDADAVGVIEELDEPRNMAVATAERWVQEHQAVPRLHEAVVRYGVDLLRRHPVIGPGRGRIQVELEAERLEIFLRRIPIGCGADRRLMHLHAHRRTLVPSSMCPWTRWQRAQPSSTASVATQRKLHASSGAPQTQRALPRTGAKLVTVGSTMTMSWSSSWS